MYESYIAFLGRGKRRGKAEILHAMKAEVAL